MLCAVANDSRLLAAAKMANEGNSMFVDVFVLLCRARGLDLGKRQVRIRRCQLARNSRARTLASPLVSDFLILPSSERLLHPNHISLITRHAS